MPSPHLFFCLFFMQVLLTAANRKGLCTEGESSEGRKRRQIVVGVLLAEGSWLCDPRRKIKSV